MIDFRAHAARLDAAVHEHLADTASLDGQPVRGMFAAPWLQPRLGSMRTDIVEPALTLRDEDAAHATTDSTVTYDGKSYDVVSVEPDGTGWTALILREALP